MPILANFLSSLLYLEVGHRDAHAVSETANPTGYSNRKVFAPFKHPRTWFWLSYVDWNFNRHFRERSNFKKR